MKESTKKTINELIRRDETRVHGESRPTCQIKEAVDDIEYVILDRKILKRFIVIMLAANLLVVIIQLLS